jgi:hydroxyacylglutathione hydrolase
LLVIAVVLGGFMVSCSSPELALKTQTTGLETNCYLLHDPASREAAIIDVGGPIDELLAAIGDEDLHLKYFLLTHAHPDHLIGVPAVRGDFPEAQLCMHRDAYADLQTQREWAMANLGEEVLAEWMEDPELRKIVEFDVSTLGEPDVFLEDGDVLHLGDHPIRVMLCPGHARGSLCYHVDGLLFSGDVLFKGSVGRVDGHNSSRDDQIASVRRLYRELADETIVYPGHGEPTTIGDERTGNERISETAVDL